MAKWEYMIVDDHDLRRPHSSMHDGSITMWKLDFEDWLNQLGDEGWEVVACSGSYHPEWLDEEGGEKIPHHIWTLKRSKS